MTIPYGINDQRSSMTGKIKLTTYLQDTYEDNFGITECSKRKVFCIKSHTLLLGLSPYREDINSAFKISWDPDKTPIREKP